MEQALGQVFVAILEHTVDLKPCWAVYEELLVSLTRSSFSRIVVERLGTQMDTHTLVHSLELSNRRRRKDAMH